SIISSYEKAVSFHNETFRDHLRDDLEEFRVRMADYERGYIENTHDRPPAFFYRHPDYFARDTKKKMIATCIVERGTFWEAGSSLPMLESQGRLKDNGID